jgi:hypothetical protein
METDAFPKIGILENGERPSKSDSPLVSNCYLEVGRLRPYLSMPIQPLFDSVTLPWSAKVNGCAARIKYAAGGTEPIISAPDLRMLMHTVDRIFSRQRGERWTVLVFSADSIAGKLHRLLLHRRRWPAWQSEPR